MITDIEKIECEKFASLTQDEREILKRFHGQLMTNPPCCKMLGAFVVELPMLVSIATGIISFLIILIQFNANQKHDGLEKPENETFIL